MNMTVQATVTESTFATVFCPKSDALLVRPPKGLAVVVVIAVPNKDFG